nr:MAG TPA: hypothetical protein [Caudoviricetes sp.]
MAFWRLSERLTYTGDMRTPSQDAPGRAQAAQDAQKPRRAYVRTGRKESRPRGAAEGL